MQGLHLCYPCLSLPPFKLSLFSEGDVLITLVPFMRVRGRYAQAEHYLQQALQAATTLEDEVKQMTVLRHLADFAKLRGGYFKLSLSKLVRRGREMREPDVTGT